MAQRDKLIKFIFDYFGEDLVKKAKAKDDYVNGVQVRGSVEVSKIALGVSAGTEFLERCRQWGANFIIVHHGISLAKLDHYVNPVLKKRLEILFNNKMTLLGFHYLLDAHREVGNNAQVLKKLGAKIIEPFSDEWGWVGGLPKKTPVAVVTAKLAEIFNRQPVEFLFGKKEILKVAVTSGGGTPRLHEMPEFLEKDYDLYVTGDVRESTPALVKEAGINYLAFGHYDTEKFGVQALGEVIQEKFSDLEIKFIDVPNLF